MGRRLSAGKVVKDRFLAVAIVTKAARPAGGGSFGAIFCLYDLGWSDVGALRLEIRKKDV